MLGRFKGVSLLDLEKVSLQDRMDTKFVFSELFLDELLQSLCDSGYAVLDINGNRFFRYDSVYYDTADYSLYHRHACGKMNRFKIRKRTYLDTGGVFFEVKHKNNRGRTLKSRVGLETLSDSSKQVKLLQEKTPFEINSLQESLQVKYTRITLVSPSFDERVTIDMDLSYRLGEQTWDVEGLVIAELKQNRASSSLFSRLMKELRIRPSSLSKYCLGVSKLAVGIKSNNFKPQLLMVNKIQNATTGLRQ